MKKWGSLFSAIIITLLLVSGCSSGKAQNKSEATDAGATAATADAKSESSSSMESNSMADQDSNAEMPQGKAAHTVSQTSQAMEEMDTKNRVMSGFNSQDVDQGLNKKLIYTAHLVMETKDYAKAQSEVRNLVTLSGGYIVNFSETESASEWGGTFVMKVPASGFSSFLNRIEKLEHETLQRNIEGQDVSEEYVDLESRLKAKQVMEEQYTAFMKKATKTNDLVSFANELERIQEEIEQIKGRMRYIDQSVAYSTVELRIFEPEKKTKLDDSDKKQDPLSKRSGQALKGTLDVLSQTFQWIIVILSGALPLLIIAAIILAIVWPIRRGRMRKRTEAAERRKMLNAGKQSESSEKEPNPDEEEQ